MDAFALSRIQFAAHISFHILFPTITITQAWILLFFKIRLLQPGDERWMSLYFTFADMPLFGFRSEANREASR